MLRVCIIGSGSFARVHAAWWRRQPGARLVAVAGRDPGLLVQDPAWQGLEHVPESAIGMPGQPWDLVDVVTPPGRHAEQATAALQAGYHVLCEKPLATSVPDAERMLGVARSAGKRLFVVSQYRFVPAYRVLKSAIDRSRPDSIRVEYTMPPEAAGLVPGSWKSDSKLSGGGILWSSGVHLVDLLIWWLGIPDGAVTGETACELPGIAVESRYAARWTAGGSAVELVSRCAAGLPHHTTVEIRGSRMSGCIRDRRIVCGASPFSWKLHEFALGFAEKVRPHRRDPLGRELADVVEAIRAGQPFHLGAEAGLRAVHVLEQISVKA